MTTNATVEERHKDIAWAIYKSGSPVSDTAQLIANLEAARAENADLTNRLAEIGRIAVENGWHLNPIGQRFRQVAALASGHTPSPEYGRQHTDGSRSGGQEPAKPDFVTEAGTEFHLPKTAPCPHCAAKDGAMAEIASECGKPGWGAQNLADAILTIVKPFIPPADPVAEALKAAIEAANAKARADGASDDDIRLHQLAYGYLRAFLPAELKSRLGGAK